MGRVISITLKAVVISILALIILIAGMVLIAYQAEGYDPYENDPPTIYHAKAGAPVSHFDEYNYVEFLVDDMETSIVDLRIDLLMRQHEQPGNWTPFTNYIVDPPNRTFYYDITMNETFSLGYYDMKYRCIDEENLSTEWVEEERVVNLAKDNITIEQVLFSGTDFKVNETLNIRIYAYHEWLENGDLWYRVETFPDTWVIQKKLSINETLPYIEVNWTFDGRFAVAGVTWDFKVTIWDGLGAMEYYENLDNITVYDPPAVVWDWVLDSNPTYRGDNISGSFWISDEDDDVSQNGIGLYLTYIDEEKGWMKGYYHYGVPQISKETGPIFERFVEFSFETDNFWTPGNYSLYISYWATQRIDFGEQVVVLNNPPEVIKDLPRIELNNWASVTFEDHFYDRENGKFLHWEYNITEGEDLVWCKIYKRDLTWMLQINSNWNVSGNATIRISATDGDGSSTFMDVVVGVNTLEPIRVDDDVDEDKDDDDTITGGTEKERTSYKIMILGSVAGLIVIVFIVAIILAGIYVTSIRKRKEPEGSTQDNGKEEISQFNDGDRSDLGSGDHSS